MKVYGLTSVVGLFALTTGCVTSEYVPRSEDIPVEFVEELNRLLDVVELEDGPTIRDAILKGSFETTEPREGEIVVPGVFDPGTQPTTEEAIREVILSMVAQSECPVTGPIAGDFFLDSTVNGTGVYRLASFDDANEIIGAGKGLYNENNDQSNTGNFKGDYNISSDDFGSITGGYDKKNIQHIGPVATFGGSWESSDLSEREVAFGYMRGLWVPTSGSAGGYIVGFSADCTIQK